MAEQCTSGKFAGIVLVRDRGREVYQKACGQADIVNGIPVRRPTTFRIFSTSKMLTAIAVMSLVEDGKMRLDSPVAAYIPDAPQEWRSVTIRTLLNHTSGIPDLTGDLLWHFRSDHSAAMRGLLANLTPEQRRLATPPGERFSYNNFGFELLADAAAKAVNAPFATILQQRLFRHANMKSATVESPSIEAGHPVATNAEGLAIGYNGAPGKLEQANPWSFVQLGAGAVQAAADDFVALDEAITANRIISAETWASMQADPVKAIRKDGSISPRRFGFGTVIENVEGVPVVGHTGGVNGYASEYERLYGGEAMFVALSNRGFAELGPLREAAIQGLKSARGKEEGPEAAAPDPSNSTN